MLPAVGHSDYDGHRNEAAGAFEPPRSRFPLSSRRPLPRLLLVILLVVQASLLRE